MIPASYLFRDVYDRHWNRPEKEATPSEQREDAPRPTLASRIGDLIAGLPALAPRPPHDGCRAPLQPRRL